jgi:hypothetical protein
MAPDGGEVGLRLGVKCVLLFFQNWRLQSSPELAYIVKRRSHKLLLVVEIQIISRSGELSLALSAKIQPIFTKPFWSHLSKLLYFVC